MALVVKNLPANAGDIRNIGSVPWEDPLKKEMATHSSILAWRNPMDRGAWWAAVIRSQRVRYNWSDLARTHAQLYENLYFDMKSPSQSDLFIFAPSSVTATWLLNIPRRNVFLTVLAFVHHPFFLCFFPASNNWATLHPPTPS